MAARVTYPFGASSLFIAKRDEQIADEQAQRIIELEAEVARLRARLAAYEDAGLHQAQPAPARRRTASKAQGSRKGSRGRAAAQPVVHQDGDKFYSLRQVAEMTCLHQSTISRQIAAHGIKTVLIGGAQYVRAEHVSRFTKRAGQ